MAETASYEDFFGADNATSSTAPKTMSYDDFFNSSDSTPAAPPEDKGYIERLGEDEKARMMKAGDIGMAGIYKPSQTLPETLFQAGGNALGATFVDPISEIMNSAGKSAQEDYPETTNAIKDTVKSGVGLIDKFNQSINPDAPGLAEAMKNVSGDIGNLKEGNPRAARNIAGISDTIGAIPIAKGVGAVSNIAGKGLETAGDVIKASGDVAAADANKQAALDLIKPKQTAKVLTNAAKKQGVDSNTGKAITTPKDLEVADAVSQVPGVNFKKKNDIENLSAIVNEHNTEAESLKPKLEGVNVPVEDFQNGLQKIKDDISSTEGIDDTERNARLAAVDKMIQITNRQSGNLTGPEILEARQKLDKTFLTANGDLTSAAEKNYKEGIKPIRDYTNNYIAEKAPDADVLSSLRKQSNLKTAIDNISTKIPAAANDASKTSGFFSRNALSLFGLAGGTVTLGELGDAFPMLKDALTPFVPYAVGTAAIAKGGKTAIKVAKAPVTRQLIGKTLSTTGKALQGFPNEEIAAMTPEVRTALLAAPDRMEPNVILGSGAPITDTSFPMQSKKFSYALSDENKAIWNQISEENQRKVIEATNKLPKQYQDEFKRKAINYLDRNPNKENFGNLSKALNSALKNSMKK